MTRTEQSSAFCAPSPSNPPIVLGAGGQLGRAFLRVYQGCEPIALRREAAELAHPEKVITVLDQLLAERRVSAVFNCAAYTQVDLAEKEKDLALAVNAEAPRLIARWCSKRGLPFVHFSTDYVFSGEGQRPWRENDPTVPLNSYGETKLAGEKGVADAGGAYLIFRTSWLYDASGKNFMNTVLRLGKEKDELRIVSDQTGAPTYAPDLAAGVARALREAVSRDVFPRGIYHLCHSGETSWHGFAEKILESARARGLPIRARNVVAIKTSEYHTPARRPLNSRLDTTKARDVFGVSLPSWEDGLKSCMSEVAS